MPIKLSFSHEEEDKSGFFKKKPIIFGVLLISILLTVVFLQRNQDIRQNASQPLDGDINGDTKVDLLDYNIFTTCYGVKITRALCTHKAQVDLNKDGNVGGIDYNILLRGMFQQENSTSGKTTPTPENSIGDKVTDAIQDLQKELNLLDDDTNDTTNLDDDIKSLE